MNSDLKKKLLKRKKSLKERSEGGPFIFIKADSEIRVRAVPVGEDSEPGMEVISFYLNKDQGRVISPATFGEKCALMNYHEKLKESDDDDDKELANKLKPKQMFAMAFIRYKDKKGKEVDEQTGVKLMLLNPGQYQAVVDAYLDSDWGDPTSTTDGYDFSMRREGKGQFDTKYFVTPKPKTPTPKKYRAEVDLKEMVRKHTKDYLATKTLLKEFLGKSEEKNEDDDSERINKKKKMMKKNKSSDI